MMDKSMHEKNNVQRLKKIKKEADIGKQNQSDIIRDIQDFISPQKDRFNNNTSNNSPNRPYRQFASEPMNIANDFINAMNKNITPNGSKFYKLEPGPLLEENDQYNEQEFKEILQKIEKVVFTYIHNSNFDSVIPDVWYGLGIGSATLLVNETADIDDPIKFSVIKHDSVSLSTSGGGDIDYKFIDRKMKAEVIEQKYNRKYLKLPHTLKEVIKNEPDKMISLTDCCYYDDQTRKYKFITMYEDDKIYELEYDYDPIIVSRWMVTDNNHYGYGPFQMALPDIRMVNKYTDISLRGNLLKMNGLMFNDTSIDADVSDISLTSGKLINFNGAESAGRPPITMTNQQGNYNIGANEINRYIENIKKTMMSETLPDAQATPATAFEIAQRVKENRNKMGLALNRIEKELIRKIVKACIYICSYKGLIELPEGIPLNDLFVKIVITSPIATIRKLDNIHAFLEAYQAQIQLFPLETKLFYNAEEILMKFVDAYGIDHDLLNQFEEGELNKMVEAAKAQDIQQGQIPPTEALQQ